MRYIQLAQWFGAFGLATVSAFRACPLGMEEEAREVAKRASRIEDDVPLLRPLWPLSGNAAVSGLSGLSHLLVPQSAGGCAGVDAP